MVGEKIRSSSSENDNTEGFSREAYRPLSDEELRKAAEVVAKTKIVNTPDNLRSDKVRKQPKGAEGRKQRDEMVSGLVDEAISRLGRKLTPAEIQNLANELDAWLAEQDSEAERASATHAEYNYRNADLYQETTFVLAAADGLMDSSDIHFIDKISAEVRNKAAKGRISVFEALKQSIQESKPDEPGEYAATDLMNAFIDTTTTYVISKDEKIARGFARGLLMNLAMRIDAFTADRPNPHVDALRVDYSIIQPIADEFIKSYNPSYDNPNAFRDHLKIELEILEADIRFAKIRREPIAPNTEREIQAIKNALKELDIMQSNYDKNLKNLHDSAHAWRRIIK